MGAIDERVTRLEERVENMDVGAKAHFGELRQFIAEQTQRLESRFAELESRFDRLDKKITWLILPALTAIAAAIVALTLRS